MQVTVYPKGTELLRASLRGKLGLSHHSVRQMLVPSHPPCIILRPSMVSQPPQNLAGLPAFKHEGNKETIKTVTAFGVGWGVGSSPSHKTQPKDKSKELKGTDTTKEPARTCIHTTFPQMETLCC